MPGLPVLPIPTAAEALLVGFAVGVALGLTGIGAGAVLTPILVLFFRLPASAAVGTALLFSLVTKAAGGFQHWRQGTADLRTVRWLAVGAVPAALAGALALTVGPIRLPEAVTGKAIAGAVLLATALLTLRLLGWLPRRAVEAGPAMLIGMGVFVGGLVALTSVGSGSVAVTLLALTTPLSLPALVGTDMVVAFAVALVTAPVYLASGRTDIPLTAALVVGSVPGVLIGSRLTAHLPARAMKAVVLVAMWGIALKLV